HAGLAHGRHVGLDLHSRVDALQATHDDDIARFEPLPDDAQSAFDDPAGLDRTILELVLRPQDEHVALTLVGTDGPILDDDRVVVAAAQQLDPRKHAGSELALLVLEHRACTDRAGTHVELIVHEVHVALVRETLLVRQSDAYRVAKVTGAGP